jgi:cytochrome c
MRLVPLIAAAGLIGFIPPAAQAGKEELLAGERAFQKCYACHSVKVGERGLSGPNLHGVVCRAIATDPEFDYSASLRQLAQQEKLWTPELLDRFIASPEDVAPGTEMMFVGLADPKERRNLIAFLAATRPPVQPSGNAGRGVDPDPCRSALSP